MFKMLLSITLLLVLSQTAFGGVGCGVQATAYQITTAKARIINGKDARAHSWPWIISQRYTDGGAHMCGGTLLRVSDKVEASDVVLTAGHCVGNNPNGAKNWGVVADIHGRYQTEGVTIRIVVKTKNHPKYVDFNKHDISLLKLDKPINFTDTIRPICLPKQNESLMEGKQCFSAGWGRIHKNDYATPDVLQQVETPIHDSVKCLRMWGLTFNFQDHVCAGALDGSSGTCQGDSGGVLACRADDGRWVQQGIVSFSVGDECAAAGKPAVYTRVSSFVDWIQASIRELSAIKN